MADSSRRVVAAPVIAASGVRRSCDTALKRELRISSTRTRSAAVFASSASCARSIASAPSTDDPPRNGTQVILAPARVSVPAPAGRPCSRTQRATPCSGASKGTSAPRIVSASPLGAGTTPAAVWNTSAACPASTSAACASSVAVASARLSA